MELSQYLRFVIALVFVLGLIALLTAIARKAGFGHATTMMRGQTRRLSISEIMPLDARRKAVLVRRDDQEHLVILGPHGETVVERGIDAPPPDNPEDNQDNAGKAGDPTDQDKPTPAQADKMITDQSAGPL